MLRGVDDGIVIAGESTPGSQLCGPYFRAWIGHNGNRSLSAGYETLERAIGR